MSVILTRGNVKNTEKQNLINILGGLCWDWGEAKDCLCVLGVSSFNCVQTRCIVKTSGFTRRVCKDR